VRPAPKARTLNDEELGVKRDGTASDKREGDGSYASPTESDRPPSVDEPIAGEHQTTPSSEISTLMTEVLHKENLRRALERVKRNKGAPGIDGMTVDELSAHLKANWPSIRAQLVAGSYQPKPVKRVEIPKPDGRKRLLGIPTVTDRFIQQALAQVVQRQWDGHFHPNSYGFRPGRSAHQAMRHAQTTIRQGYGWVVDIDLEAFFDRVNHDRLMVRVRQHVDAPDVLRLINRFLKGGVQVNGQTQATIQGVPQGGPFSPLAANIYLNEVDWYFDDLRRKTAEGPYEAINYHRFADDTVITVSGHGSKRGWAERALQRLQEQLEPLGVELNREKTKMVDTLKGEAFGFLGFDLRRVHKRQKDGYKILMTPKKKARKAVKAKIRDIIRSGGANPVKVIVDRVNAVLAGWVNYFRVGNSSRAFSEVRDYLEMKIRTILTRRKRRRKTSIGWRRWSNAYLYDVLKLFWDWKIHPLPGAATFA